MSPSTILITGANGSLALAAVSHLLKHAPSQTLLLTVRNAAVDDVNTQALRRLVARRQEGVYIRELDLSRLERVRDFAREVEADIARGRLPPLASIVCNAYYWNLVGPVEMTVDGFEKSMQVSHLSHAALVMRLIRSCGAPTARILLLSSAVHRPGRGAPFEKLPPSIPSPLELLVRPEPDADDDRAAHGFQRFMVSQVYTDACFDVKDPSLKHISVVIVNPGVLSDSRALLVNTPRTICLTSRLLIRPLQPLLRLLMDRTIRTSAEAAVEMARLATNEAVLYIAWSIMAVYVNLAGGIGKPLWQITLGEYAIWFKGFLASSWMYTSMTAAIRIAILLFYRRIFAQSISWLRRVIHLLLALQAVYVVVYSVLPALACRPFDSAWNPFERRAHCDDWFFYYSQVALYSTSMVFDLVLLVLPLQPCSRLQMRRGRKAGVIAMFALGAG
ncbi:NAD(P)-binding protein [Ophiocordyceps camponoti-floridani]|uniref:NAD(P)-binding protein n=1 Tax=Ophiocordyceps camponoti-floridani TaxID=2030778 RepID=A0A8H4QAP0_9HYPO|nr:NAD(P)-binding protein [Ophiocordyceps camponoti-floridani]